MNYELAKELTEAGFSRKRLKNYEQYVNHGLKTLPNYLVDPTLEELIDECPKYIEDDSGFGGKCVFSLSFNGETWTAMYDKCDYQPLYEANGSTPKEAVARLWLVINKKP